MSLEWSLRLSLWGAIDSCCEEEEPCPVFGGRHWELAPHSWL